jgi:quercetin 2,3-dioxygenase
VNLPAKDKLAPPRYQNILSRDIPVVPLEDGQGEVRVIAGEFAGKRGPAKTFTPVHVWDLRLKQRARLQVPEGFTTALVVLQGSVRVNGSLAEAATFALLDRVGTGIELESTAGSTILVLSGQPIDEPIVGMGPFVMNTRQEIQRAMLDYQTGRMGQLA